MARTTFTALLELNVPTALHKRILKREPAGIELERLGHQNPALTNFTLLVPTPFNGKRQVKVLFGT